jgi:hypothetical protein
VRQAYIAKPVDLEQFLVVKSIEDFWLELVWLPLQEK